uniref:Cell cycle checkpoint control protein n=1 Tax=Anopheles farauti TaxID=69004 RepID=A0A182QY76_9DIPT
MNFILPGGNVKMLARAVNCFSKIGNELYFEATPDGLDLKTINSTNTAYAVAQFRRDFFINFQQGNTDTPDENCCKISVKPILKIFKSLATIQTCKVWLDTAQSKIIFQFRCKSDVLKTHKIYLLESEHINSLNLSQTFPSEIVGSHKVFSNILVHLYHSVDEISFELGEDKTIVSNYVDNAQTDRSTLRSTLSISSSAFQLYQLASKANLVFCYKEFKAITMFATLNKLNIQMNFSEPGSPLMLQMSKGEVVHAKFIMGTMNPAMAFNCRQSRRRKKTEQNATNQSVTLDSEPINTDLTDDTLRNTEVSQAAPRSTTVRNAMNASLQVLRNEIDSDAPRNERSQRPVEANSVRLRSSAVAPGLNTPSSEAMFGEKNTDHLPFLDGLVCPPANVNRLDSIPTLSEDGFPAVDPLRSVTNPSSPPISNSILPRKRPPEDVSTPTAKRLNGSGVVESVAESPEVIEDRKRKQAKLQHLFKRCFEPTFNPVCQSGMSVMFVEASDTEDGE